MNGRVVLQVSKGNISNLLIEDVQTKDILSVDVDKLSEDYTGKIVSIYTTVTEIVNHDFYHIYPKGTLGT